MSHAFRSRTSDAGKLNTNQMCVAGTYNMDQKVTVEWEQITTIEEIEKLYTRLPEKKYTRSELRALMSGFFKEADPYLPPTKISKYRISPSSVNEVLTALESTGVLERHENGWFPRK